MCRVESGCAYVSMWIVGVVQCGGCVWVCECVSTECVTWRVGVYVSIVCGGCVLLCEYMSV